MDDERDIVMLYGSSIVPSVMYIGGKDVQLGTIVGRAYTDSGLSRQEWNALPELDREGRIAAAIYKMREEAESENG